MNAIDVMTSPVVTVGLLTPVRDVVGILIDKRISGVLVVDIDSGNASEWARFAHTIDELYDVAVLPGARAAEAIGFKSDEIEREITVA